jgi:hypothetical protein
MKPHEQDGVVDDRLDVYGVQNLKIAGNLLSYYYFCKSLKNVLIFFSFSDLSITPGNVGANTYDTAIAIGEKAAVCYHHRHHYSCLGAQLRSQLLTFLGLLVTLLSSSSELFVFYELTLLVTLVACSTFSM